MSIEENGDPVIVRLAASVFASAAVCPVLAELSVTAAGSW
jgi:hypothetical protein